MIEETLWKAVGLALATTALTYPLWRNIAVEKVRTVYDKHEFRLTDEALERIGKYFLYHHLGQQLPFKSFVELVVIYEGNLDEAQEAGAWYLNRI